MDDSVERRGERGNRRHTRKSDPSYASDIFLSLSASVRDGQRWSEIFLGMILGWGLEDRRGKVICLFMFFC